MKKKLKNSKKINNSVDQNDDPLSGDLSHFISDGNWQNVQFELREKKDKVLSVRLSEKLLKEIKKQAEQSGLGVQKYIRILIESTIRKKAS
jgi:predicted DNA binding CopG/RHH family protein